MLSPFPTRGRWQRLSRCLYGAVALFSSVAVAQDQTPAQAPTTPTPLFKVQDARIDELSGLAASRAYPGCFWAHNDSGDTARLFLLNAKGETVAVVNLAGVTARDWEDIAFAGGYLYVGDIGDNDGKNQSITVYRLREPSLDPQKLGQELTLGAADRESLTLRYPDGAHDAETLAATPDGRLLIVSKNLFGSTFYASRTPFAGGGTITLEVVASNYQFGRFNPLSRLATGGDLSDDGRKLAVCTYTRVVEFPLDKPFDFASLRLKDSKISDLPAMKQCESVCYSPDGKTLFVSSEGKTPPLYALPSQLK